MFVQLSLGWDWLEVLATAILLDLLGAATNCIICHAENDAYWTNNLDLWFIECTIVLYVESHLFISRWVETVLVHDASARDGIAVFVYTAKVWIDHSDRDTWAGRAKPFCSVIVIPGMHHMSLVIRGNQIGGTSWDWCKWLSRAFFPVSVDDDTITKEIGMHLPFTPLNGLHNIVAQPKRESFSSLKPHVSVLSLAKWSLDRSGCERCEYNVILRSTYAYHQTMTRAALTTLNSGLETTKTKSYSRIKPMSLVSLRCVKTTTDETKIPSLLCRYREWDRSSLRSLRWRVQIRMNEQTAVNLPDGIGL